MSVPFTDVMRAARSTGPQLTSRMHLALGALAMTPPEAALALGRIAAGNNVDTLTVREIEIEILALDRNAQSLILRAAPGLRDFAADLQAALRAKVDSMSAAFGALVPWSAIVDATLLQACREAGWGAELLKDEERRQELSARLFRSVGIGDVAAYTRHIEAHSAQRKAEEERLRSIEASIRAKLPKL